MCKAKCRVRALQDQVHAQLEEVSPIIEATALAMKGEDTYVLSGAELDAIRFALTVVVGDVRFRQAEKDPA